MQSMGSQDDDLTWLQSLREDPFAAAVRNITLLTRMTPSQFLASRVCGSAKL